MHKGDFLVQIYFTGVQRLIYNYKLELFDNVTLHAPNLMGHNFEPICSGLTEDPNLNMKPDPLKC